MRVHKSAQRIRILLIATLVVFAVLIGRLTWVQLISGPKWTDKAMQSWRREIPIAPKRGNIIDRRGVPLVVTVTAPSVYVVPAQVRDPRHTARTLARLLGVAEQRMFRDVTRSSMLVRIQQGRKLPQHIAQAVRHAALPGVFVAEDHLRVAVYGALAAHVLGVTGIDNQGLTGIEARYDEALRGRPGSIGYIANARGAMMPHTAMREVPSQAGNDVALTIDARIQTVVERELDTAMAALRPRHVLAVAVDPRDGSILAMGSRPTFDPARFRDTPSAVYNRILPIWMTYEPGSTFKIITLAAALQERVVSLDDSFFDSGAITVGGATLHCWKHGGHGQQTFAEVVQNSCNPGFVVLGQRLGKERLFHYIRAFGFGKKTGIEIGGEENGILFSLPRVGPVELATTAFGQGVSVTPIQQVMAVAAAINGGTLYAPRLVHALRDGGRVVRTFPPRAVRTHIIDAATSRAMRQTLESVVALGTGRQAFVEGYRVGGKTGTAQIVVNGRYSSSEHIVSFVGFAPADDPRVLVYVAVDNPVGIQFGGRVAAPIAGRMLHDALRILDVPPRVGGLPRKEQYGDVMTVVVPDVVGATKKDIMERIGVDVTLVHYGEGTHVVWQQPVAGTRVPVGSRVQVYWRN
ncbi:MAG: PASTA domain-containing protein [Paenibacillaceae bacterium]|nr:PASTA domain-containing protein [Paenibacillaceae bacterium]